jgi:hypothetical protein
MSAQKELVELNAALSSHDLDGRRFRAMSENEDPFIGGVVVDPPWSGGGTGFMVENETFRDADAVMIAGLLNWIRDHGPSIAELIEACAAGLRFHWYMEPESRQSHLRLTEAIRKLTEPKA